MPVHTQTLPLTLPRAASRRRGAARRGVRLDVDAALLARCRSGEPGAFELLFERLGDHVYNLALSFCGDEAAAADVTQEVFLKLLERIGQFREDAEFSTWLYRVVKNAFLDHHRRQRPWAPLAEVEELEERPEVHLAAPQEDAARRGEIARHVRRAVAGLEPASRLLLVLRYSAELSYEEIAEVLGIAPGTVASRLARAHQKLARKLRPLKDA